MDDLVEWLKRQLDDDEAYARNAFGDHNQAEPEWTEIWSGAVQVGPNEDVVLTNDSQVSRHMVRHDPARVLREVEAKRRRLQRHQPVEDWVGHDHMPAGRRLIGVNCSTCRDGTCGDDYDIYCAPIAWPCPEIRDDLSVYSDRPRYQESWRP